MISAEKMQAVTQSTVPQSHIIFDCIVLITGIDRVCGVALLRTGKPQHHPGICSGSHSVKLASTFDLTCSTSTHKLQPIKRHTHAQLSKQTLLQAGYGSFDPQLLPGVWNVRSGCADQ